jgi:hypothetical protein
VTLLATRYSTSATQQRQIKSRMILLPLTLSLTLAFLARLLRHWSHARWGFTNTRLQTIFALFDIS